MRRGVDDWLNPDLLVVYTAEVVDSWIISIMVFGTVDSVKDIEII